MYSVSYNYLSELVGNRLHHIVLCKDIDRRNEGVHIVGSTSMPWALDGAIRRRLVCCHSDIIIGITDYHSCLRFGMLSILAINITNFKILIFW